MWGDSPSWSEIRLNSMEQSDVDLGASVSRTVSDNKRYDQDMAYNVVRANKFVLLLLRQQRAPEEPISPLEGRCSHFDDADFALYSKAVSCSLARA